MIIFNWNGKMFFKYPVIWFWVRTWQTHELLWWFKKKIPVERERESVCVCACTCACMRACTHMLGGPLLSVRTIQSYPKLFSIDSWEESEGLVSWNCFLREWFSLVLITAETILLLFFYIFIYSLWIKYGHGENNSNNAIHSEN